MSTSEPMTDFETSLSELEQLVSKMEQGQLTLEDSLAAFERGVQLTKACQTTLKNAEQRVKVLLAQDETLATKDFDETASD